MDKIQKDLNKRVVWFKNNVHLTRVGCNAFSVIEVLRQCSLTKSEV